MEKGKKPTQKGNCRQFLKILSICSFNKTMLIMKTTFLTTNKLVVEWTISTIYISGLITLVRKFRTIEYKITVYISFSWDFKSLWKFHNWGRETTELFNLNDTALTLQCCEKC